MAGETSDKPTFDIRRQRVGTIYAKALLGAADEAGKTAEVLDEFRSLLEDVIEVRSDLRHAIVGAILNEEERLAVLEKAFRGKMEPVLLTFLKVVTKHERQDSLHEIYAAAVKLNNERLGLIEVTATTAATMPEELANSLSQRLHKQLGRQVVLRSKVDPEVIGGLVLQVGDTVFDGSVANRLKQLRQQAIQITAQQAKASLERFTST